MRCDRNIYRDTNLETNLMQNQITNLLDWAHILRSTFFFALQTQPSNGFHTINPQRLNLLKQHPACLGWIRAPTKGVRTRLVRMSVCANTSCIATIFYGNRAREKKKKNKNRAAETMRRFMARSGDAADGALRGTSPLRAARELINAETHSADMWFGFEREETIIRCADPPSRCEDDC